MLRSKSVNRHVSGWRKRVQVPRGAATVIEPVRFVSQVAQPVHVLPRPFGLKGSGNAKQNVKLGVQKKFRHRGQSLWIRSGDTQPGLFPENGWTRSGHESFFMGNDFQEARAGTSERQVGEDGP